MSSPARPGGAERVRGRRGGSDAAVARPVLSPSPFLGRLNAVFFWGGGLEYEETLPVAPSKCNYSRLVRVSDRPVFFSPGAESEESFKDFGKNREAMRLCREGECFFSPPPSLLPCVGPKVCFDSEGLHTELASKS